MLIDVLFVLLVIFGGIVLDSDLQKMFSLANQIKSDILDIEGLVDVNVEQQVEIPQLQIRPRREMLKQYGIQQPIHVIKAR